MWIQIIELFIRIWQVISLNWSSCHFMWRFKRKHYWGFFSKLPNWGYLNVYAQACKYEKEKILPIVDKIVKVSTSVISEQLVISKKGKKLKCKYSQCFYSFRTSNIYFRNKLQQKTLRDIKFIFSFHFNKLFKYEQHQSSLTLLTWIDIDHCNKI